MTIFLETERLLLKELDLEDLDFMTALLSDPLTMRYFPKLYSRKEVEQMIEKHRFRYRLQGHSVWLLQRKDTKEAVGELGLVMQSVENKAEPEIGYILHPKHWKNGYATEAGLAVRDYAFEKLNYPYVISLVRPVNKPSQAVARRLGMEVSRKAQFFGYEHLVFRVDKSQLRA
ncbi:MAG: GNAT family N-acetyltransferase [Candidatus Obscuribacterales bacterium]|nr:GNAT family N-acetyltransferase [Candidatus Obscuribacterales bacterium]